MGSCFDIPSARFQNSGIAKSFLFDITCLVYVATDYSPVDNASFELCCDYVQTLASFSNLYKYVPEFILEDERLG